MEILIIVILPDFPSPMALSRRIELISKGLTAYGHKVTVAIPRKYTDGELNKEYKGIKICWMIRGNTGRFRMLNNIWSRMVTVSWLFRALMQNKFDCVITYDMSLDSLPMVLLSKLFRKKVITTYHDVRSFRHAPLLNSLHKFADILLPKFSDGCIVASTYLERQIQKTAPNRHTIILPPLVDRSVFNYNHDGRQRIRTELEIPPNKVVVGYFGSFWKHNGLKNLLLATDRILNQGIDFSVIIAGPPNNSMDADNVPQLIEDMSLEENVTYLGLLDGQLLIDSMSACDVLVIPRLNVEINEAGAPTKLAEYMSMARAVIVADIGDIPRYVEHKKNALLIEPGNLDDLVNSLLLVQQIELVENLSMAADISAQEIFEYRHSIKNLNSFILDLK